MNKTNKIPQKTITRLALYFRSLLKLGNDDFVKSDRLAHLVGFNPALVRRDLTYFGNFGTPGKGYQISELKQRILKILGIDKEWKIALIGVGNLGSALLTYEGFKKQGFNIVSVFDNDKRKIGNIKGDSRIQDIKQLKSSVEQEKIKIAIIAIPAADAQKVVNYVISCGISTILNFAPIRLRVPNSVNLVNIDMVVELERLCYLATNGAGTGGYLH
jgi:redox-sensing transcriptional repressor